MEARPSHPEVPYKPIDHLGNVNSDEFMGVTFKTLRTFDSIKTPLGLDLLQQCYLVRVSRMAGRDGGDMLDTIESSFDILSV